MKLSRVERRWVHAVFDGMFPRAGDSGLATGIEDLDVDGYLDDLGRSWPPNAYVGLRAAIAIVALAPIVVLRTPRTFVALSPDERVRVLESLYASDVYLVRSMVTMLKATGGILYGASETVRRAMVRDVEPHPTDALVALRRRASAPPPAPRKPTTPEVQS